MYPRYISVHRKQNEDEVLVVVDSIAYVEDNGNDTSTIVFNYGGGFSVNESYEKITEDLMVNVKHP